MSQQPNGTPPDRKPSPPPGKRQVTPQRGTPPHTRLRAVVFGITGFGKTSYVRQRLSGPQSPDRVLIVDPYRQYGDIAVVATSLPQLADFLDRCGKRFRIAYQSNRLETEFPILCRATFGDDEDRPDDPAGGGLGPCCFVVEEVQLYCDPNRISAEFRQLITVGRHRYVDVVGIARRPAEVNRLLTSQTWELVSFNVSEPNDIRYLQDFGGEAFVAGLQDLHPGIYRRKLMTQPLTPVETAGEEFHIRT